MMPRSFCQGSSRFCLIAIVFAVGLGAVCSRPLRSQDATTDNNFAIESDVVVYGLTSAGVVAAVQSARMGKSVSLVGSDSHLGGMSSSGLGRVDVGASDTVGGISREVFHRAWQHYQTPEAWYRESAEDFGWQGIRIGELDGDQPAFWRLEPHVAELIFESMIAEQSLITVYPDCWLDREHGQVTYLTSQ